MKFRSFAALILALLILSQIPAFAAPMRFADVSEDAYYYDAVVWAAEHSVASGTGAGAFSPDAACTRAQIVTFLWRAMGMPPHTADNPFRDVKDGAYYHNAVLWAYEKGIASGKTADTFDTDGICTRAQAAAFLWRALGSGAPEGANPFLDVGRGAYYYEAVLWAYEHRIAAGTSAVSFSPDAGCTRGQIVAFLYRCFAAPASDPAWDTPPETDGGWKLILVNADHPLPKDFTVTLKELRNGHSVDERIYPELQQMFDDARAQGIYPLINESFRTAERQQEIMDKYIARYRAEGMSEAEAVRKAKTIAAEPGTSEHQLGLALDIIAEYSADSTATWKWLKENGWRYGFILRYPEGKEDVTGFSYEPWHFRYVGAEAAKTIMEKGITLEEYLGL